MNERARRVGLNEAVFREVNERIQEISEGFGTTAQLDLICECGNAECAERVSMKPRDYEGVRADPTLFAVVPGHTDESVEEVVRRQDDYEVVKKRAGEARELAEATDPRS